MLDALYPKGVFVSPVRNLLAKINVAFFVIGDF